MKYRIVITKVALRCLDAISDLKVRKQVMEKIDSLADEPEKRGKSLTYELAGYLSLRAAGQRYMVIYTVELKEVTVVVVALGIRRGKSKQDIYQLAKKLIMARLV
ncbi:MAG: type II toxin-antitoxin system RelE/ParE family toxin [Nitrospinae bacterium]|nr:type II toxin-antitoxin system RelE/ParE family toxin [Nitrospinota bacterium]